MENAFKKVVEHIFSNWTALNLAVEHSEATLKNREAVLEFTNYMVQYCLYTSNIDEGNIQEALDDIMDQEFETICEDNSTREIATILHTFLELTKQKDMVKFEEEYQKLPVNSTSSITNTKNKNERSKDVCDGNEAISGAESVQVPMEQDSEWIEVKSKRRH